MILRDVQRRVPAGQRLIQEAFTTDHRHPVFVKLNDLKSDTFYLFDEFTACAFREAIIDWSAGHKSKGRLTLSCSAFGEFKAEKHRLQHITGKVAKVRVLAVGTPERFAAENGGLEIVNTNGGILSSYQVVLKEGRPSFLFICRSTPARTPESRRYLGFFTCDPEMVDDVATDIDLLLRKRTRTLPSFDRLQLLHQTTQRVARELESYSRRMELAIQRARRRPDLLTAARFERIVRQSIVKMEQLKDIPRRALRTLGKSN